MTTPRPSRVLAVLPMLLLTASGPAGSPTPDAALIDKGTIGIATYAMLFVIVALLFDRWMDRRALNRLADALDRSTKADSEKNTALLVQMSATLSVLGRVEQHLGGRQ